MLRLVSVALLVAVVAAIPVSPQGKSATRWHELEETGYSFSHFVKEFGKVYANEHELATRREIFEKNLAEIIAHNNKNASWKNGINHLSDRTDAEYRALLGFNKNMHSVAKQNLDKFPNLKSYTASNEASKTLPKSVDWRRHGAVTPVKDQGGCGTCYAFASVETTESRYFVATGHLIELSEQQAASCTKNPLHCGGTGGCGGGIAELVFEGVISAGGIASEWVYPYNSHNGTDYQCSLTKTTPVMAVMKSYVKLPENKYQPLLDEIQNGPMVVTVDASTWKNYEEGVFDGCDQTNPDLNHLVELVGYGEDVAHGPYWLVRNSWTDRYGEEGYIRVRRTDSEETRCGIDKKPQDGSGCDGGPATVNVCGTCGILYDVSYPTF